MILATFNSAPYENRKFETHMSPVVDASIGLWFRDDGDIVAVVAVVIVSPSALSPVKGIQQVQICEQGNVCIYFVVE